MIESLFGGRIHMRGTKNGWTLLLLVLSGVVLGGFIGSLAAGVPGLDWLNYGDSFGLGRV